MTRLRTDPAGRPQLGLTAIAILIAMALAAQPGAAAVKVRADFDKAFNFQQARTWAWDPHEAGRVVAARTASDDPEEIQRRAEPLIRSGVDAELPRRGLKMALATPDLVLNYYLLLTVGSTSQTMGQFLPATVAWGLPIFPPATTSFEMIEKGALVLDLSANGKVVWRGIAEAKISTDLSQERRAALIGEAVREIVKKYPPKK